jgi:hypothetical protein
MKVPMRQQLLTGVSETLTPGWYSGQTRESAMPRCRVQRKCSESTAFHRTSRRRVGVVPAARLAYRGMWSTTRLGRPSSHLLNWPVPFQIWSLGPNSAAEDCFHASLGCLPRFPPAIFTWIPLVCYFIIPSP